ncbi:hypothetical protein [Spongorhabdus nitratireducens]
MSGPISSDRIGGPDFSPLPGSNPEAGKSTEASTVSRGVLTSTEGVTVSRDGAAVATAGNAAGQAHRLDAPSQVLTPSNFATAQGEVGELLFDFQPPQQRKGQPKKNPVVALAALAGELTPEELETESAGGLQQKLERNHKDKSQLRTALGQNDHETGNNRSADSSRADNRAEAKQGAFSSAQADGEVNPEQLDSAESTQRRFDQSQDKSQVRSAAGEQDTGSAEEAREGTDASAADGRNNKKVRKNPLAGLAPAPGVQTEEELEAESALGSQRRLENRQDKSEVRKAASGVDEQAKEEIESDKLARQNIPALANYDTSSEEAYVDIYQVMAIMHKMANSNRQMAKESRAVSYEAAKNEILNQAKEMKAAATKRFIGAVVQNAAQIASAGVSLGALKGADPGSAQIASARATAAGSAVTGAGGLAAAAFNFEASKHDAKVKEHEAYQKTYENSAQSDTEFMNAMQDMVRSVQSAMAEIIRAKHETEKSIIRS